MKPEIKQGIIQAALITSYCGLIATFMSNAEKVIGKEDPAIAPLVFLVMLSTSVLICALLVFKKPYELFFAGKKKEAANVVVYTAGSLLVVFAILFVIMLSTNYLK